MSPPNHRGDSPIYDPEMPNWAIRLEGKVDTLVDGQHRIQVAIDGTEDNPAMGLRIRVHNIEQGQIQRDKALEKAESRRNWWTGLAVSMGGIAFGAWVKKTLEGH